MTPVPDNPKIYHITHVDNLPSIIRDGVLWSDFERIQQKKTTTVVGMSGIKKRRLEVLPVPCHPKTKVGEYVPFYFCPRSVMLFLIFKDNHLELTYHGGQGPIIHLEASLHQVITWANAHNQRWACSLSSAGTAYTQFYSDVTHLADLHWEAIAATNWADPVIKEGKQAEFLLFRSFPWHLVERIGVECGQTWRSAVGAMAGAAHRPQVQIIREWYY
jgi:hypothetical protein